MFKETYSEKKVLVTGNTGFKGSWLSIWLHQLGAKVYGLSNGIPTTPSMFAELKLDQIVDHCACDVRDQRNVQEVINRVQPDFIFHLAAQPIVGVSYSDPVGTIHTNALGTIHILEAARSLEKDCVLVMITSDKCYENVEWVYGYRETDRLGGKDIYSASKAAAEILIYSFYHSFIKNQPNLKVASVRAGNVIGGGDWAEKRLVPDCVRAWANNDSVVVRNPSSTRPWQHVLEPLSGYLVTGENLYHSSACNGIAFNFGPPPDQVFSVRQILEAIGRHWELDPAREWVVIKEGTFHEAGLLKLTCDRAHAELKWWPVLGFDETAAFTASWYREFYQQQGDMLSFTREQIQDYVVRAKAKDLLWTKA